MVLWNRLNVKTDPSKLPLVEGQVLIHEQENGATMYIDTDAYDDGQIKRYVIGGASDPGHLPILQDSVTVAGPAEAFAYKPDDLKLYVLASCYFSEGGPIDSETPLIVLIDGENKVLTALSLSYTYRSFYQEGFGWQPWTTSLCTVPSYTGFARELIPYIVDAFPSHIEILIATITSDAERPDPSNPYYSVDILAFATNNMVVTASYGDKEYQSTYNGTAWTNWKLLNADAVRYFESEAKEEWTFQDFVDWVHDNVVDYNVVLYDIEFADVTTTSEISPTGLTTTHYKLEAQKMTSGGVVLYATILSGGTDEYPTGTQFRNFVDSTLTPAGWQVITSTFGLTEVADATTVNGRSDLLDIATEKADGRNEYTIVFDSVSINETSERPISTIAGPYWVEVIKTSDRTFMRFSSSQLVSPILGETPTDYYNLVYYTRLSGGGSSWLPYTPYNAPLLADRQLCTEINEATEEVGTIPTTDAVTDYINDKLSGFESANVGEIKAYAGTEVPANFLLCDGRAVSRTTYSKLFEAIGTTFGAGDGETTFNLPDLAERFIEGAVDETEVGTYLYAGLPNIKGNIDVSAVTFASNTSVVGYGAFSDSGNTRHDVRVSLSGSGGYFTPKFDASLGQYDTEGNLQTDGDVVYGRADTVQPPALKVMYIIRYRETPVISDLDGLLQLLYPIGKIEITMDATDPGTRLGFGTWELLSEGQTLWSTTPTSLVTVGTEIAAGLPNIKGDVGVTYEWTRGDAFTTGAQKANSQSGSSWAGIQTGFNAAKGTFGPSGKISEANSPYGKSDTVQPPAIAVYMWKRVS